MSCQFSREMLALHVEGDLPDASAAATVRHLAGCEECRRFLEELQASQALMKSVRRETVNLSECSAMRREVMRAISERPGALGWRLRIERAIALGLRPSYGIGGRSCWSGLCRYPCSRRCAPQPIRVSRRPGSKAPTPCSARTRIGTGFSSSGATAWTASATASISTRRAIASTRKREYFPRAPCSSGRRAPRRGVSHEGPHATSSTLLASLKDSTKFEGGWGFFDFGATGGAPQAKVRALPESRGCRSCHRQSPLSLGA